MQYKLVKTGYPLQFSLQSLEGQKGRFRGTPAKVLGLIVIKSGFGPSASTPALRTATWGVRPSRTVYLRRRRSHNRDNPNFGLPAGVYRSGPDSLIRVEYRHPKTVAAPSRSHRRERRSRPHDLCACFSKCLEQEPVARRPPSADHR
jgi:hypothetical protein